MSRPRDAPVTIPYDPTLLTYLAKLLYKPAPPPSRLSWRRRRPDESFARLFERELDRLCRLPTP